mmetsp:Transcript_14432/g.16866  ORF Transcript_14432/g.16866 Transcript_14432/m.16866 type:complete len:84 (-) Transcript_14432:683-934(-)
MAQVKDIDAVLKECKAAGHAAYIPYLTAAWPTKDDTVPLLLAMEKGGAHAIELGMPFSDPLADGKFREIYCMQMEMLKSYFEH